MSWLSRTSSVGSDGRSLPIEIERPKHHDTIAFDLKRAQRFAKLSHLAYFADGYQSYLETEANKLGYELLDIVDASQMHAVVFANDEGIIVAFRGTDKFRGRDIYRALSYEQTDGIFGAKVHKGCFDCLQLPVKGDRTTSLQQAIEQRLESYVAQKGNPPPKVYFTGHSVGGSIACLSAAHYLQHQPDAAVEAIYTFGQQRVGDANFADRLENHPRLNGGYYRVVMSKDPMPLFPGKYGRGRNKQNHLDERPVYKHGGQPIILHKDTLQIEARSSTETLAEQQHDQQMPAWTLIYKNPFIYANAPDHTIQRYSNTLNRMVEKECAIGRT